MRLKGLLLALAVVGVSAQANAAGLTEAEIRLANKYGTLTACEDLYKRAGMKVKADRAEEEAKRLLRKSIRVPGVQALQVIAKAERYDKDFRGKHGVKRCNRELRW